MKLAAYSDKREVLHLVNLLVNVKVSKQFNDTVGLKLVRNVSSREDMAVMCNKH